MSDQNEVVYVQLNWANGVLESITAVYASGLSERFRPEEA